MKSLLTYMLLAGACSSYGQSYEQAYTKESRAAVQFAIENREMLDSVFGQLQVDPVKAFSIVAPEVGHYLVWRDLMETSAVKLFYGEMGSDYADFSIGFFQMKMSFVERLEAEIKTLGVSQFQFLVAYPQTDQKAIRQERLRRMETLYYQACYVAAFVRIMERTRGITRLQDLALLYNRGFRRPLAELEELRDACSFPAMGETSKKYAYPAIAEYYSQKLISSKAFQCR